MFRHQSLYDFYLPLLNYIQHLAHKVMELLPQELWGVGQGLMKHTCAVYECRRHVLAENYVIISLYSSQGPNIFPRLNLTSPNSKAVFKIFLLKQDTYS